MARGSRVTRVQLVGAELRSVKRRARLRQIGSGGYTRESHTLGSEEEFTLALHLWPTIIGLPALLGCAWLSAACQPAVPPMTPREVREALRQELQLVTLENCTLARVGSAYDGGYLMCRNLIEDLGAVSYGVGPNDDWGCQMSTAPTWPRTSTTASILRGRPARRAASCSTTSAFQTGRNMLTDGRSTRWRISRATATAASG